MRREAALCITAPEHRVMAIESGAEHPDAADIIEGLKEKYNDVLFRQQLARDVDPEIRGPYGVATIELKDGAVPHKKRPFRMQAEREDALRKVIGKGMDRTLHVRVVCSGVPGSETSGP